MTPREIATFILAAIITFGFGGVLMVWIVYPPQTHSDLMSAMVTALGAGYLQVINFIFVKPKE